MQISICFISKQFGVHTVIPIIQEMHVSTPIIGKILEGSLIFLITKKNNAPNGRLRTLFRHTQMDVSMNTDVNSLMVGKNKNTIH